MRATTAFLFGLPLAAVLSACNPPAEQDVSRTGAPDANAPAAMPGTPAPDAPAPAPGEANAAGCGADKLGNFINVLPTSDILDQIKARIGDKAIRVINPGDAVTMDFRPDRLNVEAGADGRIKQFRCY